MKCEEGNRRHLQWNNAKVELPILSTKKLNKDGGKTMYDEDEGWIINKTTGDTNHFISAAGVYFWQLFLPKDLFDENTTPCPDFGRPG